MLIITLMSLGLVTGRYAANTGALKNGDPDLRRSFSYIFNAILD